MRMRPKQNNSPPWGPYPTKVVCEKSTSKQMIACFFDKTGIAATVPLEQYCTLNSEWYTTISLKQFEKRTNKDKSVFTMAMPVLAHWLKSALMTGQNVELMGQPTHSPDLAPNDLFNCRTSRKYCVVNDFRQTTSFVKLVFSSNCKQHK